ncbi:sensor histidine kinase [Flavisphingomonas formosensis]|uniref:sensor histidine kinase n=1 Tax=Flavisphingomonas formosensis TaxID=861534 RepID=UPI002FCD3A4A
MSAFQRFGTLSERQFNRLVLTLMSLGFLALIAAGTAAGWLMLRNQDHTRWLVHTYQVEQQINLFRLDLERTETARRGLLIEPTARFRQVFDQGTRALGPDIDRLATLTSDNSAQYADIAELRRRVAEMAGVARASVALIDQGRRADALERFSLDGSVERVRAIRSLTERMLERERALLLERDRQQRDSVHTFFVALGILAVLLVLVGISSLVAIRRYTTALSESRGELKTLNESLEDLVEERTSDLKRANDEIQRFAYIVSHDLRSPLVNVLGFTAELDAALKPLDALISRADEAAPGLIDDQSRIAVREDVPEAIGFIRSSTQKMDRLINAILKLSREGRRTITPEPLDMTQLAHGVADGLHHRIAELGAEIHVAAELPAIVSDRLAIEQIMSNLVENAVKYLQPGRPGRIEIRGHRIGLRAIFEVQDNGRGIDPKDHARIFDLFRRSGVQDQPGEGIGLAHVRALAYRLGGTIDCASALGEGATFRLSLPLRYSEEQKVTS